MTLTPDAHQTFEAMPAEDRRNLARLSYWLDPERERLAGEHLTGPEYAALRRQAVIGTPDPTPEAGLVLGVTPLGRAVLHYIGGGL